MLRIVKATLVLAGGLLMTVACFQPWQTTTVGWVLCLQRPISCPPPIVTTSSIYDIWTGMHQGFSFGGPSQASAALLLFSSVVLILIGIYTYFRTTALGAAVHMLQMLWFIVIEAADGASNSFIVAGSGVSAMLLGWILAAIGLYFVRSREETPRAERSAAPAAVSSSAPTAKAE